MFSSLPYWTNPYFLWNVFWTFWTVGWLRLNRFIVQNILVGKKKAPKPDAVDTYHSIVVIGDGIAEGYGDIVTIGRIAGVARYLQLRFAEKQASGLKHNWQVLNLGHYGSTSDSWLPNCTTKPACFPYGVRKTLWEDLVANPLFVQSKLVVLSVGSMDKLWGEQPDDAEATVKNIETICDHLVSMGKCVAVNLIPASEDEMNPVDVKRNFLLSKYLNAKARMKTEAQTKGGSTNSFVPGVIRGADYASLTQGSENKDRFCFDHFHVTYEVHRLAAQRLFQELLNDAIAVEWEAVQKVLVMNADQGQSEQVGDKKSN